MERRNAINSRIRALESELAELEKYGEDVYQNGDVLIFTATFSGAKKYHYAALKAGGSWFITGGANAGSYLTWDSLVSFWQGASISKIRLVTQTRKVL